MLAEPVEIEPGGRIEIQIDGNFQRAIEARGVGNDANIPVEEKPLPVPVPAPAGPDLSGLSREELAVKLGDESFATREAAQAALRGMFADNLHEMMDFCFELFRDTPDPEIRMRCRDLMVEHITGIDVTTEGRGFVGILLNLHAFFDPKGELVMGVRVQELVPGAPGAAAGMRPADLIVKIDDLDVGTRNGDRMFQDYVAAKRPGTKVRMKIMRGNDPVDIELALGRRPEMGPTPATPNPEQLFRDWLRERLQPAE